MAGYSKGIVDTRKLNKNSKAKLGRGGDTKIREVDNRASHVNALEAYLIDVNGKAGEEYAKRVGAGTVNPLTGMPEYHDYARSHSHPEGYVEPEQAEPAEGTIRYQTLGKFEGSQEQTYTNGQWVNTGGGSGGVEGGTEAGVTGDETYQPYAGPTGRQDYETLAGMDTGQLEDYLQSEFGIGEDSMKYIEGFQTEPFGFLGEEKHTALKGQFLEQRKLRSGAGFAQEGIEHTRDLALGGLLGQEKALGLQMEGIGRTAGRGLRQAGGARATAASRSGLATSGTITQAYETQKKDLFQDYTAGAKGVQLGMEDIGRQRTGVLGQYDIQRRQTAAGLGFGLEGVGLAVEGIETAFDQGTWLEQQRQLDELYADVGTVSGVVSSDKRLKENVDYIGDSPSGIKMYEFNYLNNNTRHRGVMADDLVDSHPKALSKDEGGYYMVDYSQIDVNFEIIKED